MRLEFDGIRFGYTYEPILSDIYMLTETGRVTGLIGRNGSGKSTLLRIVFGSLSCEASVRIDGMPVIAPAFKTRKIAYLPQGAFIPADLTVHRVLELYEIPKQALFENFPELVEDRFLSLNELSGGRRRLFEVLLILNISASFCLLDEPFTGLTPLMIERVMDEIQRKKMEKGILISDHLYRQVLKISDHLYILKNGKTHRINEENDLVRHGYLSGYHS